MYIRTSENYGRTFKLDRERGWKICNKCNIKQELNNFGIDYRFNLYVKYCKTCGKIKTNINRNKRRKNNINYKIRCRLTGRIRKVLIGKSKSAKTMELIGCDLKFLMSHLESQFEKGMNWKNYGSGKNKWHIEHIIPTSLWFMDDPRQQKIAFNYKNLRPMWEEDNLEKSDKLPNGKRVQDLSIQERIDYIISIGYGYLFIEP